VVLRYLRRFDELPDHTDQLFVVDRDEHLRGVLPLNRAAGQRPGDGGRGGDADRNPDPRTERRRPTAAQAFERYDLVSAPVVDADASWSAASP
jgi:magnesium transporter